MGIVQLRPLSGGASKQQIRHLGRFRLLASPFISDASLSILPRSTAPTKRPPPICYRGRYIRSVKFVTESLPQAPSSSRRRGHTISSGVPYAEFQHVGFCARSTYSQGHSPPAGGHCHVPCAYISTKPESQEGSNWTSCSIKFQQM